MDIKYEINKRRKENDDNYALLGVEIKSRRLAQSKTLSSVAKDNCSVSYLCKIERNQIKGSPKHLREICESVGISEEKASYLLGSRELLIEAVKSFYFNDLETQNKYLSKLSGLDNHRVVLIKLVFALTRNDLAEAKECINKLYKLTSALASLDLLIFATFYGVYCYKIQEYVEAADYLKIALDDNKEIEYIDAIINKYLFLSALFTSSPSARNYYNSYENYLIKYGSNLNLEYCHYGMCYYYLLNENYLAYKSILKKISNPKSIYTLEYIYNIRLENKINADISLLDDLGLAYYMIYNNQKNCLSFIDKSKLKSEFKYYLHYLYLKRHNLEEAYDYLLNIAFPLAIKRNLFYFADYYLEEMALSIHRPSKYKRFFDMYLELNQIKKIISQI